MARWVTVDLTVGTITLPTPPVDIDFDRVRFPSIGPFRLPDLSFGPFSFNLPDVSIPRVRLPIPSVSVGLIDQLLPPLGPFPVPDVELPRLFIDTDPVTIPIIDFTMWVVDPFDSGLFGGHVGTRPFTLVLPGTVPVPDVDVSVTTITVGGHRFRFPDVNIPGFDLRLPDVPRFDLPDVNVPAGLALIGEVTVPDPTQISVETSVKWGSVRSFMLDPLPTGFLTDPAEWAFETVLAELEKHVTVDVARVGKRVLEGFLQLLLSEETKQEVRDQAREK